MFGFTGEMRYATNNSGRFRDPVKIEFTAGFFPGHFKLVIHDALAGTIHEIENKRFNFQARDSPEDLLARDKWRSEWFDKFTGDLYLQSPRITGVTRELRKATVTCSWNPAFCVVEYRIDDTYYQFACRPPRGMNRWYRRNIRAQPIHHESPAESHEPSSASTQVPSESSVWEAPPTPPPNRA